jgi:DNA-binding IclR family transcriptional regulator
MIRGALVTQLIYVAARLGIADLLQTGPKTPQELATTVGADAPTLYRILRALASLGLFAEAVDGRFEMTPLAELLRGDAHQSLRGSALLYGEA